MGLAVATINRARCAGSFDADSKRLALGLRPHLECAYLLHRRIGLALAENDSLRAALDQVAVGLMLVERDGRVLLVNATAEQTLERSDVAHLALSGRLVLKDRAAMDAWHRALASTDVLLELFLKYGSSTRSLGRRPMVRCCECVHWRNQRLPRWFPGRAGW